jgi:hypothetical protein
MRSIHVLLPLFFAVVVACGGTTTNPGGQGGASGTGASGTGTSGGPECPIPGGVPPQQGYTCPPGDDLCLGLDGQPGMCCVPPGSNPAGFSCMPGAPPPPSDGGAEDG